MSDPGLYFKNKLELIKWFQREMPESYSEYLDICEKVGSSKFPGSGKLFKREKTNKIADFESFLTELNIANHLLNKKVRDLVYEPKSVKSVGFQFDDVILSVKNLAIGDAQRGKNKKSVSVSKNASVKKSSNDYSTIEIENNRIDTITRVRTEIDDKDLHDSDQMSLPMKFIGEFENAKDSSLKKVLFMLNDSQSFDRRHLLDIGNWYFDFPKGYKPIFADDMSRYVKLFGKAEKKGNIDALIFMYPPDEMIWPKNSFTEMIVNKHRMIMFCPDRDFKFYLLNIFS